MKYTTVMITLAIAVTIGIPLWITRVNSACEAAGGVPMMSSKYFTNRLSVKCYDPASLKEINRE